MTSVFCLAAMMQPVLSAHLIFRRWFRGLCPLVTITCWRQKSYITLTFTSYSHLFSCDFYIFVICLSCKNMFDKKQHIFTA